MSAEQIRMATDADRPALEAIWDYCFQDGERFERWYFSTYYRKEECIVGCVDDVPVASLQVIDLPTRVGDQVVRAGYIVGVDCLPEYRGQGFTRRLMDWAIDHYAPAHNLALLHLMPFEADFYEPYGFVYSDFHFDMDLDIAEFYRAEDREAARRYHWKRIAEDDLARALPLLEQAYEVCTATYPAVVERRGLRRWQALVSDLSMEGGHLKILLDEAGKPQGLLAYILKEDALFVREALAAAPAARRALYYFIASHRSQVKNVQWSAPEDEPIVFQRRKDKQGVRYRPFMMNRLVDPSILPLFSTSLPTKDLAFAVPDKGAYLWPAGKRRLCSYKDEKAALPIVDLKVLSKIVFDRGEQIETTHEVLAELAALFTIKTRFFNNEYF